MVCADRANPAAAVSIRQAGRQTTYRAVLLSLTIHEQQ